MHVLNDYPTNRYDSLSRNNTIIPINPSSIIPVGTAHKRNIYYLTWDKSRPIVYKTFNPIFKEFHSRFSYSLHNYKIGNIILRAASGIILTKNFIPLVVVGTVDEQKVLYINKELYTNLEYSKILLKVQKVTTPSALSLNYSIIIKDTIDIINRGFLHDKPIENYRNEIDTFKSSLNDSIRTLSASDLSFIQNIHITSVEETVQTIYSSQ